MITSPHQPRIHRLAVFSVLLILPLALLAGGCGAEHNYSDEGEGTANALDINSFGQQWSTKLETRHGPVTRVFARDVFVFGYTDDGTSYVLDRPTGALLHAETIRHGNERLHPPVVLKDFIVYPTNTSLEIYDRSGNLVRSKDLRYSIRSDAVGSKTFVYFGADFANGGRLVAVDVTNEYLDMRWSLMFPRAAVSSAPALLNDIVYVAAENGDVAAVSFDSREPVWTLPNGVFHTYDPIVADLAADETGVYVASTDTKLESLNRNNGHVRWQYSAKADLHAAPVVSKDLVFQLVPKAGMVAIDKVTGAYNRAPRWTAPDVIQILSEDEQYVYVLRQDKAILALDKASGAAVFSAKRHDYATYTTNTKDGIIYSVTRGNRVIAFTAVLKPGVVGHQARGKVAAPDPVVALAH